MYEKQCIGFAIPDLLARGKSIKEGKMKSEEKQKWVCVADFVWSV